MNVSFFINADRADLRVKDRRFQCLLAQHSVLPDLPLALKIPIFLYLFGFFLVLLFLFSHFSSFYIQCISANINISLVDC